MCRRARPPSHSGGTWCTRSTRKRRTTWLTGARRQKQGRRRRSALPSKWRWPTWWLQHKHGVRPRVSRGRQSDYRSRRQASALLRPEADAGARRRSAFVWLVATISVYEGAVAHVRSPHYTGIVCESRPRADGVQALSASGTSPGDTVPFKSTGSLLRTSRISGSATTVPWTHTYNDTNGATSHHAPARATSRWHRRAPARRDVKSHRTAPRPQAARRNHSTLSLDLHKQPRQPQPGRDLRAAQPPRDAAHARHTNSAWTRVCTRMLTNVPALYRSSNYHTTKTNNAQGDCATGRPPSPLRRHQGSLAYNASVPRTQTQTVLQPRGMIYMGALVARNSLCTTQDEHGVDMTSQRGAHGRELRKGSTVRDCALTLTPKEKQSRATSWWGGTNDDESWCSASSLPWAPKRGRCDPRIAPTWSSRSRSSSPSSASASKLCVQHAMRGKT